MKKTLVWMMAAALMMLTLPRACAVSASQVWILDDYWYGGPSVESDRTNAPDGRVLTDKPFYAGGYGDWKGLRITVRQTDAQSYAVAVQGEYERVQAMSVDDGRTFERAVRIPVRIQDTAPEDYLLANGSGMRLVLEEDAADAAWLYLPLSPEGVTAEGILGAAGDPDRVRVAVRYENSAYDPASDRTAHDNVSFELLAYAGAQSDHFRAQVDPAHSGVGVEFDPQSALDGEGGSQAVNTLTFQIAALTPQDRAAIFRSASYQQDGSYFFMQGNDAMAVKLRPIGPDGMPYPAGTLVEVVNLGYGDWAELIGATAKTVSTSGKAAYYLDEQGCFTLTCPGITVFAAAAAGLQSENWRDLLSENALQSLVALRDAFSERFQTPLSASAFDQLVGSAGGDEAFTFAYRWRIGRFGLQLTYGARSDLAVMDLYFQNTPGFGGASPVLPDALTLAVGESVPLPHPGSGAQTPWTSILPTTAAVTGNLEEGFAVHGISVGTTYLFCAGADGQAHLLTVTVTPAPPEIPPLTRYAVTASELSLRAQPSAQSEERAVYPRNTVLYGAADPDSAWVAIYDETGAALGYCYGGYLTPIE